MSWGSQLPADEAPMDSAENMIRKLEVASQRGIDYFVRLCDMSTGQIGNETDLGAYAKLVNAFIFNGKIAEANALLDYCVTNFLQENGDFKTRIDLKSSSYVFGIFYPYTNKWLLQAGISLRRYDFVFAASRYIDRFYNPIVHCSTIIDEYNKNGNNVNGVFNSAALGTTYLYLHKLDRALKIGDTIIKCVNLQEKYMNDEKNPMFYLRFNDKFEFIKNIPLPTEKGQRIIYKINASKIKQPWFAIGYPIAFLGQLYQATKEQKYLDCAEVLLRFAIDRCNYDCRSNQWAHKLMWGASIIGQITNKREYWQLCFDIANTCVNGQDPETGRMSNIFDQSAEMSFWLPIIAMKIRNTKLHYGDIGVGTKNKISKL